MSHLISDLSMVAMFYYLATYINRYLIIQVYTHSITHSLIILLVIQLICSLMGEIHTMANVLVRSRCIDDWCVGIGT